MTLKFSFFLLFMFGLHADAYNYKNYFEFNPAREFPTIEEMKVGVIKNDQLKDDYYDLIISDGPLQDVSKLGNVIHWAPNGTVKCSKAALNPLLKTLIKYGKCGNILDEDPLAAKSDYVVTWKTNPDTTLLKSQNPSNNGVCYSFSGGRLGDNIIAYLHAKWISLKYGLPLVYNPFDQANSFALSQSDDDQSKYLSHVTIFDESEIDLNKTDTLYFVPYFPESMLDFVTVNAWHLPFFKLDFEDPVFKQAYREALKPQVEINKLDLPKNRIKVAMHMRRGGLVDNFSFNSQIFPLKFPPDTYYINELKRVYELFDKKPLYVHLFTDAQNQIGIIRKFERLLKNYDIVFQYSHNPLILDDFYDMSQFDVLIRSTSNFSLVGGLLSDHILTIAPLHANQENGFVTIDRFDISFKGNQHFK